MYYDESGTTTSEESSYISSIESGDSTVSDTEEEVADEEILSVRKIKANFEEMFEVGKTLPRLLHVSVSDENDEVVIDRYIETMVNVIKNFDRLETYNVELITLAAAYDTIYKGIINEKNITTFVGYKEFVGSHDPIDIMRYIMLYTGKK